MPHQVQQVQGSLLAEVLAEAAEVAEALSGAEAIVVVEYRTVHLARSGRAHSSKACSSSSLEDPAREEASFGVHGADRQEEDAQIQSQKS